jgi:transcription initiation factor TFIID TATA-box-binding protein
MKKKKKNGKKAGVFYRSSMSQSQAGLLDGTQWTDFDPIALNEIVEEAIDDVGDEHDEFQDDDRERLAALFARKQATEAALARESAHGSAAKRKIADETLGEYSRAIRRASAVDGRSLSVACARMARRKRPSIKKAVVDLRLFEPLAWIWDAREAANAVTDEDLLIHQRLVALLPSASQAPTAPPETGTGFVCNVVASIADVRLQSWMLAYTPPLFTTNTVATADFGVSINALALVNRIGGASFNPRCFAAVKLRMHNSTHLIFSEGLVVCTGSKSVDSARVACIDMATLLMRSGIYAQFLRFELHNVVSTSNTGFDVDLAPIATAYPINAHYVPDSFPGLIFRIVHASVVLIVFKSGCCILTGAKSRGDAMVAWTWFYCNILWQFRVLVDSRSVSDTEYGRRARQDESMVELVCESVRDVTQSLIATKIAQSRALPDDTALSSHADHYFHSLCAMTKELGATSDLHAPSAPRLDLEDWLQREARRAAADRVPA